jgi:tetratricopeptide (TPR) repeat protein
MVSAEEAEGNVCANCGIAGVDSIRLEECDKCDLVKYCSTNCREEHREQHKDVCKIRKAELHDRRLFTLPDGNHRGECPICFLPMPLDVGKSAFRSCCGQWICMGCAHACFISNKHDTVKATTCAFCQTPTSDKEEYRKRKKERIEANDPAALRFTGADCYIKGNYDKARKYWETAAELGNAEAHCDLGCMYMEGIGVEKDENKAVYHWEKAAIGGHPQARHNLAYIEGGNGNLERAKKHLVIAAKLGHDKSMKWLLPMYQDGFITKEEYGATLRTHQAAVDATKSSQREVAERRQERIKQEKDRKNRSK